MNFVPYMHIERYGTDEVQGIELGDCYVFPKIDGTNGSVWYHEGDIYTGSRNRELTIEEDNQGFCKHVMDNLDIYFPFIDDNPDYRLYGEWLKPHTFKHYRDDAWNRFYVFDVYNEAAGRYFAYPEYEPLLKKYNIDYIPPLCLIKNATHDNLLKELGNNNFLVKDGKGEGEGIVIKNYQYQNRFGRLCFAKMVTNRFKDAHPQEMGVCVKKMKDLPEQQICDKYLTVHLVDKIYAKIVNECGGWNSKYIPRLLNTVWHDLVTEETWNYVKDMKNPTINFKTLNQLSIIATKQLKPELF